MLMPKIYKILFPVFALICLIAPHTARASHVMGSDITWKCLGGDTFEVTVTAYRDCNGIPLSGTNIGCTTSEGCSGSIVTVTGASKCCGKDITPVCQKSCTRCTDLSCDFEFGIQQWTITAKYVLPAGCCNYKFNWEECCRNGAITTLSPGDFYSEVTCNRCVKNPCDNSPYFTNPPVGIFCVNECVVYNPGANDDDRDVNGNADSLSFSFGDPLSGPGAAYSYNSPYTSKTPVIYSGTDPDATFQPPLCLGFHLDPLTGDIEFKATKTDVTVFCIVVDEYRRDSLGIERKIGTVRRDLQISIIDCPANHTPIITGINGGTTTSIKICADQQTCFTIRAFDIDPNDTVIMNWNNQIPGASFTVKKDGKKWPTGTFCWRPQKKDVRSYPYQFIITALDNHCPIPGRASRAFSIYVIASPEATHFTTIQKCGLVYFQADVAASSTTGISDYLFTGEGAPGYGPLYIHAKSGTYQYTRPGTYHYTLTVKGPNGCSSNYSDSVKIAQYAEIHLPKDTIICEKNPPITITATPAHAIKPYSITWDHSTSTADNITVPIIKDTVVVAHIKDATGCKNYDSMRIHMQLLPRPNIGPNKRGCWGHPIRLTTGLKQKMPYAAWIKIQGKDTIKNFLQGDTILVNDSGKYVVSVRDSIGCNGYDTVDVFYNPLVRVTPLDTDACINDSVKMDAGIAGLDATFKWIDIIHQTVVSTARTYTIKAVNTKNGHQFLVIINQTRQGVTCIDSGYKKVRVHNLPTPKLSPIDDHCIDDIPFSLDNYVDKAHLGGAWYYAKNSSAIVANYLYPSIIGPGSFYVHYKYADQFRCPADDSEMVNITDKPNVYAGPDTEICTKNGRYDLTAHINRKGGTWTVMAGTPKSALVYSPAGDTAFFDPAAVTLDSAYYLIYKWTNLSSKAKCSNADTVRIRVRTNPTLTISKVDTLCGDDLPVQLNAQPSGGIWTIVDGTTPQTALVYDASSNSYAFDPKAAGGMNHKLLYTAYGDPFRHMCSTSDTLQIYVAPKPDPVDFATEDGSWEYCMDHADVKLVPTKAWPGGSFTGNSVHMIGNQGYFVPSKGDTTDQAKNVISYNVPYNQGKCNVIVTHTVKVDFKPVVAIDRSGKSQCEGNDSFTFKAALFNCTDYKWFSPNGNNIAHSPLSGNSSTIVYHPTQSQLGQLQFWIYLDGWNTGKCAVAHDSIQVNINPRPIPTFSGDDTIGCEPLTVHFSSNYKMSNGSNVPPLRYDWDFADGSTSTDKDPTHIFNEPAGQILHVFPVKFKVTVNTGCFGEVSHNITVNGTPRPKIYANPQFTTIAVPQIQFDLDTSRSIGVNYKDPNTTYYWSFGDGSKDHPTMRNPQHTYGDTGTYWVKLYVTSAGCVGVDSVPVIIKPELIIFIPNVFTPDTKYDRATHKPHVYGAKRNETFQPEITDYSTFSMNIYNRWGELLFTTTDPNKGWDGTYKGQPPVMDAYVYVIKATSYSGKPYTFTGTVTILL
jgi:gliding motility-associated-like protein